MNMATEPTAPTMKAAGQIIAMIILKASMAGLCSRSWSTPAFAGFWVAVSIMIFRMTKRAKPSIDARRRNMNCLAVRQGWTNARTKAVAARKANSMPGGLSSIPTAAAAIADKPQITKRISVLILLCGVEKASIMIVSFFDSGFRLWLPNYDSRKIFSQHAILHDI
jgi:hypothetical protein